MPAYQSLAEVRRDFRAIASTYDLVYEAYDKDVQRFIRIVNPKQGEHVLILGVGSAKEALEIKGCVGNGGIVVGIDACRELLESSAKANIVNGGYSVLATTDSNTQRGIYLIVGDVKERTILEAASRVLPLPASAKFDAIVGCKLFPLLPFESRLNALRLWKEYLAPGGRLVLEHWFHEQQTECPAMLHHQRILPRQNTVTGVTTYCRQVFHTERIAPDSMWEACRKQVSELAQQAGMDVASINDFYKDNPHLGSHVDNKDLYSQVIHRSYKSAQGRKPSRIELVTALQQKTLEIQKSCDRSNNSYQNQLGMMHFISWANVSVVTDYRLPAANQEG